MSLSMGSRPSSAALWLACVALAVAPPMLAATTFDRTFSPGLYLGFAVPILIAEAFVVLAALATGMRPVAALLRFSKPSQFAILFWLSALAYANLVVAPFGYGARLFVLATLLHGLFALALVDRLSSDWAGAADRLLLWVGWGALAYCVLAYGLLLTVRDVSEFNWMQPGVGVSNARQLGFYGLTCGGIGAGFVASPENALRLRKALEGLLLMTVGGAMCFWSGGRAAAGAFLLAIAISVVLSPSDSRKRISALCALALVAGAALSMTWLPDENFGLPRILNSVQLDNGLGDFSSGRIVIWIETLGFWLERPLFGYGLGQFKFLVPAASNTITHPHNALIQFLFQWGLVGTAAVLVISRKTIVEYVATVRFPSSPAGKIAVCLLTGHGAMSMLEGNLFHIYPVSVVIIALAVLGARSFGATTRMPKKPGYAEQEERL